MIDQSGILISYLVKGDQEPNPEICLHDMGMLVKFFGNNLKIAVCLNACYGVKSLVGPDPVQPFLSQ